ncbi:MAG: PBSX family phage terminase large subunit [Bacteroidales bacterium]|nr:PBSX family phage terminase large subunit [Bacteroidales bacterium]
MAKSVPAYDRTRWNPLAYHLWALTADTRTRFIILWGGSSSGKSYSVAQILLSCAAWEGENMLVLRKVGSSVAKSTFQDFKTIIAGYPDDQRAEWDIRQFRVIHRPTGARIDFQGLDDPEKIKGLSSYRRVFMDELNEFDSADFKQIRKRLRGKKGQQIIAAFNPVKETHWIKTDIFDSQQWEDRPTAMAINGTPIPPELTEVKSYRRNLDTQILNPRTGEIETHPSDTVLIQSTYLNNFWVVGSPDGTYGYYDEQCVADFEKDRLHDPDYYNVYALGEWGVIRSGSEFFASFSRPSHVRATAHDPSLPVHISVDSNVLPYITVTYWQADITPEGVNLRQIAETCASHPDNTVRRAAKLTAAKLKSWGVDSTIIHGDASTRAANNIDEQKRSFLDLFISTLAAEGISVEDRVGTKNPPVAMSGEFINAVWDGAIDGHAIVIGEDCPTSIEDYLSVQKDENGGILKTRIRNKATGQSYEEHGHISDTARYIVCDLMPRAFTAYTNRRKRNLYAAEGFLRYFNPDTPVPDTPVLAYIVPNQGGKLAAAQAIKAGDTWNIVRAAIIDNPTPEQTEAALPDRGVAVIECSKSYYPLVRDWRTRSRADIRVIPERGDIDRRVAATSDYVRTRMAFNPQLADTDPEYSAFITSLLDYNRDGQNKEAVACLSGFAQYAAKHFPD